MMMPANFSAVNAEVVYGGAVADYLPSAWTAESVKRFNSNIITLVSNSFTSHLLKATLGTMFSGNWASARPSCSRWSLWVPTVCVWSSVCPAAACSATATSS